MRRGRAGSFWPSREQELLLKVALLKDERGARAWSELRPRLDIQRLEAGSTVLLPLLYDRLREQDDADRFLPRLKGVYRYVWYRNQVAMKALLEMLTALRGAGIESIVFGGAALVTRYYRGLGVRPIDEAAVLVRPSLRDDAVTVLTRAGWSIADDSGRSRRMQPSGARDGRMAALHSRLPVEFEPAGDQVSEEEVWRHADVSDVRGTPTLTLDPSDELLLTCVGGARSGGTSNVQWIPDAMTILRVAESDIDWETLISKAVLRRRSLPLLEGLRYLTEELDAPIPGWVVKELGTTTVTRRERFAHRISGRGGRLLGNLPATVGAHVVASQDQSVLRAVLRLPDFVRAEWGVDRFSQLPAAAARRSVTALSQARAHRRSRRLAQRHSSASSSGT
ncbi:MAG TPA: nucleotidyltransferase family protein [Gaiellaceae bacterium]|nr:nucleotidyltransferase family protein [Gaiellaceae bacterium]